MSETRVTLATIGNGAALDLFEHEFQRVIANIADINTNPKQKRKINLEVEITPAAMLNLKRVPDGLGA